MALPEYEQLARQEVSRAIDAANLPVVDEETASAEVKELYEEFRKSFGRPQVPGILQCFATHPPLLAHMMGLAKSMLFVDGSLGRKHKEMISTFVSASNDCAYCADSHAFAFRVQGGTKHALDAVLACDLKSAAITAEERTLLQLADKVTHDSHSITSADIEATRVAGWTDLQIAETIHVAALFAAFNRVVNAFGLPSQEHLRMFEEEISHGR